LVRILTQIFKDFDFDHRYAMKTSAGITLASQSISTSNQIICWLKEMESLRNRSPKSRVLSPVMGK
jgi:hypothetical protein